MNNGNSNDNKAQNGQGEVSQNQNPTLNDPGAAVADYGKADQQLDELEHKHGRDSGKGNSSIPLDNEDTIGNP